MRSAWLTPDWSAPPGVRALMTTRVGGVSRPPYDSLNLGDHVGDDPGRVARNRTLLAEQTGVAVRWLTQVHGTDVVAADGVSDGVAADASVCRHPGLACAVMTADCLPVLFCSMDGDVVAAAHAGWRGLCHGVLEAAVASMEVPPERVLAWLGAAIGPAAFEVGSEVRDAFVERDSSLCSAFAPAQVPGKWMADLYAIAQVRLRAMGVRTVTGGGLCTYGDADRFYSYRRDGVTGRMVSMIWLTEQVRA